MLRNYKKFAAKLASAEQSNKDASEKLKLSEVADLRATNMLTGIKVGGL